MKIKIITIALLLFNSANAQLNCDTSALIKSFIQIQFGPTVSYDLQDYKCLKKNNKAQETILRLLRKDWIKEDYIEYVYKIVNRDSINLRKQTMQLTKKDSTRYSVVYDSLKNKKIKVFEEMFLNDPISDYLIELAGYLYYKESIPALKKILSDPKANTNPYPQYIHKIRLSLARLGDVESENDVIKLSEKDTANFGNMLNKLRDIYFTRSQKGLYNIAQLLKSKRKEVLLSEGSERSEREYISYEFLSYLKSGIANKDFQDYFNQKYKNKKYWEPAVDNEDIQFAIQWFEKNKGKYIIKQD